jgi:1,4-alpha-glucan branching enzyme
MVRMAMCCGRTALRKKDVEFKLSAPQACKVSVVGSFNNWTADAFMAKKDSKGNWTAKAKLEPGQYEYKFVVDNTWMEDPNSVSSTQNAFGTKNSVLTVE